MPRYLVLGSGGREHALAWKLSGEPDADVIVAPGNAGVAATPHCRVVDVSLDDRAALVELARREIVDLTVVGPEAPLCAGLADRFEREGLPVFGPVQRAAELEGSKAFAKEVMRAAGVPTASHEVFEDLERALEFAADAPHPLVVKADGLAGGKGVVICENHQQSAATLRSFVAERRFGSASTRVVIEELLAGPELSFMVITDGTRVVELPTSQDHKRVGDHDTGPNTGGMGAITPSPHETPELRRVIRESVVFPVLAELRRREIDYRGFLYAGLMLTPQGPKVLEFNVRLGDPETQALMMGIEGELGPLLLSAARGELPTDIVAVGGGPACCIVLAAEGYPGKVRTGDPIQGLDRLDNPDVFVFHAGTAVDELGRYVTRGGRVLGVTGRGATTAEARKRAYDAVEYIEWSGMHHRSDIGSSVLTE